MIHPSSCWDESLRRLCCPIPGGFRQKRDGGSGPSVSGVPSVKEVYSLTSTYPLVPPGSLCFHQCSGHSNTRFHHRPQIQKPQRSFRPWYSKNNLSACSFCKWSNRSWWHCIRSPLATQLLKQGWNKGWKLLPSPLIFFLPIYTSSEIHHHSWEAESSHTTSIFNMGKRDADNYLVIGTCLDR